MTTQHTPGPWELFKDGRNSAMWSIQTPGRKRYVIPCYMPDFSNERQANARLIAAAPELLEACIAAERLLCCTDANDKCGLRAAIAKARGE